VQSNSITGYINNNAKCTLTLKSVYSEPGGIIYETAFASKYLNRAFNGFLWFFSLEDTIKQNLYFFGASTTCTVSGCTSEISCSYSVTNLTSQMSPGCIPSVTSGTQNVNGAACSCSSEIGCNSTACLDCESSSCSCFTDQSDSNCTGATYSSQCSCLNCYSECSTCSKALICLTCNSNNSSPTNDIGCKCNTGYYNLTSLTTSSSCIICSSSCLSCSGGSYYQCTSCSNNYLGGVCLNYCPLGYQSTGKNCSLLYLNQPIVVFSFNTIGNFYEDSVSGLVARPYTKSGTQNSSELINSNQRGLYFPGSESLKIDNISKSILALNFTFSMWIKPLSKDAILIYKTNSGLLFSISIISLTTSVKIFINSNLYQYSSPAACQLNEWNYISTGLQYQTGTLVSMYVNSFQSQNVVSEAPFLDEPSSTFIIGSDDSLENVFIGFIYQIAIYADPPSIQNVLVTSDCELCNFCPETNSCIPSCNVTQYYNASTQECTQCSPGCKSCINSFNCSLCADSYCKNCTSFSHNSCVECIHGFEVIESACVPCNASSYFNTNTSTCEKCLGLCTSCLSDIYCSGCTNNSVLTGNNVCVCKQGYTENKMCIRNVFKVNISINSTNSIKLSFTEPLLNLLERSSLIIKLNNINLTFFIEYVDQSTYFINLNYLSDIPKNSNIKIILNPLTSVNNSLLSNTTLAIEPFETISVSSQEQLQAKINSAKTLAETGALAGLYTMLGGSIINLNLVSLFNFINTAEIFYSTVLFNLDLDPTLSGFLEGMKIESKLPNIFSYIIDKSNGVSIPEKYIRYGYSTNLLSLNAGVHLTILLILMTTGLILFLLSISTLLNKKLKPFLEMFKYSVFLRFWVQTYLDLLIASAVGIRYSKFENLIQILDSVLCAFVLVRDK
jgi:Concanavalin A-like lectin/glucanases superfamily